MDPLPHDPALQPLLQRLHAESASEIGDAMSYLERRASAGTLDWRCFDDDLTAFFSTKMVALDRDKAEFCYLLCRSLRAARVVEAGTSFGVSTLYLAAAVRDNEVPNGVVIGTEHEPRKAARARENFKAGGLSDFIDLREGDLRETLRDVGGPVDFMLIDIWEVALPALMLVAPHLRPGAIVICDNTTAFPDYYRDYFAFVNNPENRFATRTLPFEGGLEFTVRL